MTPAERLDFLIANFRTLEQHCDPAVVVSALGTAMAEYDPAQLAATLAVAIERLAGYDLALIPRAERKRKATDCPRCGADVPLGPGGVCGACAVDMAWEDA